jgi:hypothetical protein
MLAIFIQNPVAARPPIVEKMSYIGVVAVRISESIRNTEKDTGTPVGAEEEIKHQLHARDDKDRFQVLGLQCKNHVFDTVQPKEF